LHRETNEEGENRENVMDAHALTGKSAPWYREPWPWVLIALPLSAVIAGIATLIIAIQHPDALVAEDYYKQGLTINRVLERESRAQALGLSAQAMISDERIRIILVGAADLPGTVVMRFTHPTRAGEDRNIVLEAIANGSYEGVMPPMASGRWRVRAEDDQSIWRLTGMWISPEQAFALSAGASP
jgi:hypothetical protein